MLKGYKLRLQDFLDASINNYMMDDNGVDLTFLWKVNTIFKDSEGPLGEQVVKLQLTSGFDSPTSVYF